MKKTLLTICLFTLLFGCSSDSDGGECGTVTLISVVQEGSRLIFNYQTQDDFDFLEIGYDVTANLSGVSNSDIYLNNRFVTTDPSTTTHEDNSLRFYAEENLALSFYVRGQCSNGQLTTWQGPIIVQIEEYCDEP